MTTLINSHTNIFPQVEKTHHNDYYFSDKFNEVEYWKHGPQHNPFYSHPLI